jgi:hypothetical protein
MIAAIMARSVRNIMILTGHSDSSNGQNIRCTTNGNPIIKPGMQIRPYAIRAAKRMSSHLAALQFPH